MSRTFPPALAVSHGLLRVLIVLNILAGLLILGLLVMSFVAEGFFVEAIANRPAGSDPVAIGPMRLIMAVGIVSFPLAHILFVRLLAIIGTVRAGEEFSLANAERLRTCAWAVLGLEAMHMIVGITAAALPFHLDWEFSPVGLLAVLLLFVLAQVFAEGARMRDDLEGTV